MKKIQNLVRGKKFIPCNYFYAYKIQSGVKNQSYTIAIIFIVEYMEGRHCDQKTKTITTTKTTKQE